MIIAPGRRFTQSREPGPRPPGLGLDQSWVRAGSPLDPAAAQWSHDPRTAAWPQGKPGAWSRVPYGAAAQSRRQDVPTEEMDGTGRAPGTAMASGTHAQS